MAHTLTGKQCAHHAVIFSAAYVHGKRKTVTGQRPLTANNIQFLVHHLSLNRKPTKGLPPIPLHHRSRSHPQALKRKIPTAPNCQLTHYTRHFSTKCAS